MDIPWRMRVSANLEKQLFARLKAMGFMVAQNGTEHTYPTFVEQLKQSTDQTSLAIRFQPDGVASLGNIPRSFYVEAKATQEPDKPHTIEKTAWEQYWKLHANGNIMAIVFGQFVSRGDDITYNFVWRWNFLEGICLIPGEETVKPYSSSFPVKDGWICPRGSKREAELKAGGNYDCSGTPYGVVDMKSLLDWDCFKTLVMERLR